MTQREIIAREICRQSAISLYSRWSSDPNMNQTWFRRADQILALLANTITCPFCGEADFDRVGLKHHLENNCDEYNNTETLK